MKRIILFHGGPGSGKSTHAQNLSQIKGYPVLDTSLVLNKWLDGKEEITIDGHTWSASEQKKLKDSGTLCDWHLVCAIMQEEIKHYLSCNSGVILCGFPRTCEQAQVFGQFVLEENLLEDIVIISMDLDQETRKQRILVNRKQEENRVDDTLEIFERREETYQKEQSCLATCLVLNQADKISIVPSGTTQETSQAIIAALANF